MLTLLRKLFALLVVLGLTYGLSVYAVSDINSRAVLRQQAMPLASLQRQPELLSADALIVLAAEQLSDSLKESERLSMLALLSNPSSGRAASQLLELYEQQGRKDDADEIAELAGKLWPAHTFTRSRLADYWLSRDRVDKVVEEWNVLLIRNPKLHKQLFPFLLNLVQDPRADSLISQFIQSPPNWWNGFFAYLSRELPPERLQQVYQSRVLSSVEVTESERRSYVARLIKERRWQEAYDTWFVGLKPHQDRYSAFVFDGGFETDVYNQGFGWHVSRSKNPKIKPDITYGIRGRKALQVTLRKKEPINFRHVYQRLLLKPGSYELSFRYRTDTLTTAKGLSWRVRCIDGGNDVLVESKPLLGSNPWSTLSVSFEVPDACSVQLLRLEATSKFRHEQYFAGSLWFDDVVIRKNKAEK